MKSTFINEKKQITDTITSIKQTLSEYTNTIKSQAKKLDIYESLFKKHNIDVEKELDLDKKTTPKNLFTER